MGKIISTDFLDGYLQALNDVKELNNNHGAKYQQYYRQLTDRNTNRLKAIMLEKYEDGGKIQ